MIKACVVYLQRVLLVLTLKNDLGIGMATCCFTSVWTVSELPSPPRKARWLSVRVCLKNPQGMLHWKLNGPVFNLALIDLKFLLIFAWTVTVKCNCIEIFWWMVVVYCYYIHKNEHLRTCIFSHVAQLMSQ